MTGRFRLLAIPSLVAGLASAAASPLLAELALPSGMEAELMEGFVEVQPDGERWARFRYVMPALSNGAGYDSVQQDFAVLCDEAALPMLDAAAEEVSLVVVSLMDKPLEFGQSDPETIQFFEVFIIREDRCIWEDY
ncbi:MAG: DUF6497 family protein [Rhodobacterales bacterium]